MCVNQFRQNPSWSLQDLNPYTFLMKELLYVSYGPSETTWTSGLLNPNQAFFQLNYTRILRQLGSAAPQ